MLDTLLNQLNHGDRMLIAAIEDDAVSEINEIDRRLGSTWQSILAYAPRDDHDKRRLFVYLIDYMLHATGSGEGHMRDVRDKLVALFNTNG